MLAYAQIKARLDKARTFYLPYKEKPTIRPMGKRVAIEWVWFLIKYRKRSKLFEAYISHGDDITRIFTTDYMSRGITLLESYIEQARAEFSKKFRFFLKCRLKSASQRKKHWPNPQQTNAQIQKSTSQDKISMFRGEFNEQDAYAGLWIAMAEYFDQMKARRVKFVAINYEYEIGFSNGQPCNFVLFDINYSIPEAHCYPISTKEAQKHRQVALSSYDVVFCLNPPATIP